MATVKRIVCLANSRKRLGRCVAGRELGAGGQAAGWIRPVSAREHQEVSEQERCYGDGSEPRVLDILDLPLIDARAKGYQSENWLIDPKRRWSRVGRAIFSDLGHLADPVEQLWIDGHGTYNGFNDKIPLSLASDVTTSLRLMQVDRLTLNVFAPGTAFNNYERRVQGRFQHCGTQYWLWVTDPAYEQAYLARPNGAYEIRETYLTISLSGPHNDDCYKLIAAIITKDDGLKT